MSMPKPAQRSMLLQEFPVTMANIEEYTIQAQAFHFVVYGPGNHIPRCQLGAFMEAFHEALS